MRANRALHVRAQLAMGMGLVSIQLARFPSCLAPRDGRLGLTSWRWHSRCLCHRPEGLNERRVFRIGTALF